MWGKFCEFNKMSPFIPMDAKLTEKNCDLLENIVTFICKPQSTPFPDELHILMYFSSVRGKREGCEK